MNLELELLTYKIQFKQLKKKKASVGIPGFKEDKQTGMTFSKKDSLERFKWLSSNKQLGSRVWGQPGLCRGDFDRNRTHSNSLQK